MTILGLIKVLNGVVTLFKSQQPIRHYNVQPTQSQLSATLSRAWITQKDNKNTDENIEDGKNYFSVALLCSLWIRKGYYEDTTSRIFLLHCLVFIQPHSIRMVFNRQMLGGRMASRGIYWN